MDAMLMAGWSVMLCCDAFYRQMTYVCSLARMLKCNGAYIAFCIYIQNCIFIEVF